MHFADYKTILSPQNGMNLYRGCTHGCIYCDSRSHCYGIKHDFEDIEVKRDAHIILENQLRKRRKRGMISTGSMCDPYIPLEGELLMTRKCLEVIEKYGFGLNILTKSTLILRDIDLLSAINRNAKCVVQTTLTTFDEGLCKKIEPHVASTEQRVAMLAEMRSEGIPTTVWLSPILPYINDTEQNLQGILGYCKEVGVRAIMCFGMGVTLREGDREYFYACLDREFPEIKQKYIEKFGYSYCCNSPNNAQLMKIFENFCRKNGIIYGTKQVFEYLRHLEETSQQLAFDI